VFGGTEDRGKKHDWVFHNASLDWIITLKNDEIEKENERRREDEEELKPRISCVRIYTDNCKAQYKCQQNFYNLSKLPIQNNHLVVAEHLYAPVYGFKGPWDAAGKVAKYLAKKLEKQESERIVNAHHHFKIMKKYLKDVDTTNWEQLELDGDKALLHLSSFVATKRHAVYATDNAN